MIDRKVYIPAKIKNLRIKMEQKQSLEEYIIKHHKPILSKLVPYINPIEFSKKEIFEGFHKPVADELTLKLLEIDMMFNTIDYTKTKIGSATLYRSLIQPSTNLEFILARQDALKELESNPKIRESLDEFLTKAVSISREFGFLYFIEGSWTPMFTVSQYKSAKRFIKNIVKKAKKLPMPESTYLRTLVQDLRDFENTNSFTLIKGPVYQTFSGIKSKDEVGFFSPAIKFYQRMLKPGLMASFFAVFYHMTSNATPENVGGLLMMTMVGSFAVMLGPIGFDYRVFGKPLSKYLRNDPSVQQLIDSIGKLDEMMSLFNYAKAMPTKMILPKMKDDNHHSFVAKNLKNPIKTKTNPNYVPNDVNLNGQKITFITGPNSGGKTDYSLTITQSQILAQIGSYIAADSADINIADSIFYQAPQFGKFMDEEGRLGAELNRTKDIYFKTTPKTLIVLDELIEATSHQEKLKKSYEILEDFSVIGNNTVLVTHNDDLVDLFKAKGIGKYLQVEFLNDNPTHKLIEGISRDSHAERIERKIGFTKDERMKYLKEKGYLKE